MGKLLLVAFTCVFLTACGGGGGGGSSEPVTDTGGEVLGESGDKTGAEGGDYPLGLDVSGGGSSIDDATDGDTAEPDPVVIVNTAPTIDLGDDLEVRSRKAISLSASITDKEDSRVSILWEQIAGTTAADRSGGGSLGLNTGNASGTAKYYTAPRNYEGNLLLEFKATVTDSGGLTASDTVQVMVKPERERVQVSGPITQNTTWYGSKVYEVVDSVSVRAGATLTIEPGAVVRIANSLDNVKFTVQGTLRTAGGSVRPVVFTHLDSYSFSNNPMKWFGIEVLPNARAELVNAVIENAMYGLSLDENAGVSMSGGLLQGNLYGVYGFIAKVNPTIETTTFDSNTVAYQLFANAGLHLRRNVFSNNDDAFYTLFGSTGSATISDSVFIGNEHVIVAQEINHYSRPGQIYMNNNWWGTTDLNVIESLITDNYDDPRLMDISPNPVTQPLIGAGSPFPAGYNWEVEMPYPE